MTHRPTERTTDDVDWWSTLAGPGVWVTFGVLTVPFVGAALDTRLMTPLALPGYLLMTALTVVGSHLVPQFAFWLYWAPFFVCCYVLSVVVATVKRAI